MRKILAISTLIIGSALATLDISAVNIALPTISQHLNITAEQSIWITSSYQLAMVAMLLPLSALGDRIGHKNIYLIGLLLFVFASLLSGLSNSILTLALARFVQGVGAAGILSVSTALFRMIFSAEQMGRAQGLNAFTVAVFFSIGPVLTSLILLIADWHWLFLINIPFGMLAASMAYFCLPYNDAMTINSFNYTNALLLIIMLMSGVYGITEFSHATSGLKFLNYIVISLLCLVILIWRERLDLNPLFPVDLLRIPYFCISVITSIFSYIAQGIAFIAIPFLLHEYLGRTVIEIGLLFTPWPVMNAMIAPLAGYFADKVSVSLLCCVGLIILALGLGEIAQLESDATNWNVGWKLAICGFGFGLFQSPNLKALSLSAPLSRMGSASGMIPTARLLGLALGSALIATCLGFDPRHGVTIGLWFGVVFAVLGAVMSALRLGLRNYF